MVMNSGETLGEALPREMARVTELIVQYQHPALKGTGQFAIAMMKADLAKAATALAEGDLIGMMFAYNMLSEYKG